MTASVSPLPDSCRIALFVAPGKPLELRDVALNPAPAGGAVARISCCTLCGSDLHTVTGARNELAPSILGHEATGIVVDVGTPPLADIDGIALSPGDRITWSPVVSCGQCNRCLSGIPQKCRTLFKYGHALAAEPGLLNGGLAEYIELRPGSAIVKLDADAPDDVFCPANCATATIAAAFRATGQVAGRRVLIMGAGMLGLTAAAFAKSRNAEHVAVCDSDDARLARATEFGADSLIEWHANAEELRQHLCNKAGTETFDVILDVSGAPDAVETAIRLGEIGATIVLAGSVRPSRAIQCDPESIVRRLLTIRGVHNYTPEDLRTAVNFLKEFQTRFPFARLVERRFTLENVNEAIQQALESRPVRVAVYPRKDR